jgi:CRISPR type IV-associated protein Csf3
MEPVCVTFQMRTPLVIPYCDKHLDAVLSWAAVQRAEFNGEDNPWDHQHDIGVARHSVGSSWCFKASLLEFEWVGERGQLHYIKRSKLEDYADAHMDGLLDRRPAFDGQRGSTKAGSYLVPTRWARSIKAYAMVQDMVIFKRTLNWVTHIGKLHHKDQGAVAGVEVVSDPEALARWSVRNLPVGSSEAKQHAPTVGGLVSPYWKRENHEQVMGFVG